MFLVSGEYWQAWIKDCGYVIPSSCPLCFNSIPNSNGGSFDRVALMCCLFGRMMLAWLCMVVLRDCSLNTCTHTSSSHAALVVIYVILMSIYIWDLSQWVPRYAMLTVVEQAVSVSLPVECRTALCLIVNHWSNCLCSHVFLPSSLCPLQNSSILPDITLMGMFSHHCKCRLFPKTLL